MKRILYTNVRPGGLYRDVTPGRSRIKEGPVVAEDVVRITSVGPALWSAMENHGSSIDATLEYPDDRPRDRWVLVLNNDRFNVKIENLASEPDGHQLLRMGLEGGESSLGPFVQDFIYYLGYPPWKFDEKILSAHEIDKTPSAIYESWEEVCLLPLLEVQNLVNHGMNMDIDMDIPMEYLQTAISAFVEEEFTKFLAFQERAKMEALARGGAEAQRQILESLKNAGGTIKEPGWVEDYRDRIELWKRGGFDISRLESSMEDGNLDVEAISEYSLDVNRWNHERRRLGMIMGEDLSGLEIELTKPWDPSLWRDLKKSIDRIERNEFISSWTSGSSPEKCRDTIVKSLLTEGFDVYDNVDTELDARREGGKINK